MDRVTTEDRWSALSRINRLAPGDMIAVVVFVLATDILLVTLGREVVALRALVGFPLVVFVPGYVLLAALFPRRSPDGEFDARGRAGPMTRGRTVTWPERVVLAFGTSVALVPVFGLVVFLVAEPSIEAVLVAITAFVVIGAVVGSLRRNRVPADERFRVPYRHWAASFRGLFDTDDTLQWVANVVLLVSVVAAAGVMGAAFLVPQDGEAYSTFSLLTEQNGDLVASDYPTEFVRGESEQVTLRVENNEGTETTYTVVAEIQRLGPDGTISEAERVLRDQRTVAAGETWTARHTVTPTLVGDDLRLKYYLYRGDVPRDASGETAYRELHLGISVSGTDG